MKAERHAEILGEIRGYGSSFDAHGISEPHPEGRGALQTVLGMSRFYPYCVPWNHLGNPAMSVPMGIAADSRGNIRHFGNAANFGGHPVLRAHEVVSAMSATPSGSARTPCRRSAPAPRVFTTCTSRRASTSSAPTC